MYQKMVVCIDDSLLSERVARVGADLACRYDAEVVLLSVFDPARFANQPYTGLEAVQMLDRHSRSLSNHAHRLNTMLHDRGIRTKHTMLPGRSAETILKVAEAEFADLIVVGTEARGRFFAWLHNDIWSEVSHKAACQVLRVTQAAKADEKQNAHMSEKQNAHMRMWATLNKSLLSKTLSAL